MSKTFTPLHNHSRFSKLDGLASTAQLAERASEIGVNAIALTDHGTCAGLYSFSKECKKHGVKPILGMEAYFVNAMEDKKVGDKRRHLTLIAKNHTGYKNLLQLSSEAYTRGFYYKPRIDFETLVKYGDGLIVGTACAVGILCGPLMDMQKEEALSNMDMFKGEFRDDFFVEAMIHKYELAEKNKMFGQLTRAAIDIANKKDIPIIYTQDAHYCKADDASAHEVLLAMSTQNTVKNPKRLCFNSDDFGLKSREEIAEFLSGLKDKGHDVDGWLDRTIEVSDKIEDDVIKIYDPKDLLPEFSLPDGFNSEIEYLRYLIKEGMLFRTKKVDEKYCPLIDFPEYIDRMETELAVIENCGYVRYFLILWDVIRYCREASIRIGPGRGSGGASLCLYALRVTMLDPIKYKLPFERFLHEDRVSPPDVDMDFDPRRQEDIFQYCRDKYGEANAVRIGTTTKLGAKDSIKRVAKAMDIGGDWETTIHTGGSWKTGPKTMGLVNQIASDLPNTPGISVEDAMEFPSARPWVSKYPKVFELAKSVEGTHQATSTHAAGMIVCKEPVVKFSPLAVTKDGVCTQYDMRELEEIGLLKFDWLALKTLSIIQMSLDLIKERHGVEFEPNDLEPDDPKVFAIFNRGLTKGIFQFEDKNATNLIMGIGVDSFNDIAVANAINRPGVLGTGLEDDYVDYKRKRRKVEYAHPIMEDFLSDTFGIMIFQEDVMNAARRLAGFTPGEADMFRKVMGKKQPELIKQKKLDEKFLNGCKKNGIDEATAVRIFKLIERFAGYGFNRAHAATYAHIAYQTAYLKRYYPAEFYCSLMSFSLGTKKGREKIPGFMNEAKKAHISFLPVSINGSTEKYAIEGKGALREPLLFIDGVGAKAVDSIVEQQPFENLADFIDRVNLRAITSSTFKALLNSTAFEVWKIPKGDLLAQYEQIMIDRKKSPATLAREANEKKQIKFGNLLDQVPVCDKIKAKDKLALIEEQYEKLMAEKEKDCTIEGEGVEYENTK